MILPKQLWTVSKDHLHFKRFNSQKKFCKRSLIDRFVTKYKRKLIHFEYDFTKLLKRVIITLTNYN
ncbi:protein of unknown function [Candidatus Nitrosocosmicus franklandus]|uniref:Uncharacterized protein n=1 Tax=Candidatus Nitrosocosmicus franklandianus TaxID=1798806 RepID=A0A484I8R2_9ARCH|nr:protein of unknown function [Candidatus Nitrosocosmicus franklandus]